MEVIHFRSSKEVSDMTEDRTKKALEFAVRYGGIDGAHHKTWVIDQMVRALTGCPMVEKQAVDVNGEPYTYQDQGESDEYLKLVADANDGENGPDTYEWDIGIAP
jgi:hypothetical protein